MSTKDAYKQKIDADLELVQAKLDEFKAQAERLSAEAQIRHAMHVEDLEMKAAAVKAKRQELDEVSDDVWEQLTDSVENTWKVLQSSLENVVTTFKDEEHT